MKPKPWVWGIFWAVLIVGLPLIKGGTTYIPVTGLRLAVILMSCVFMVQAAGQRESYINTSRVDILILIFWVLAGISLFITNYLYITVYWFINIMIYMALFYLGLNSFGRKDQAGMNLVWFAAGVLIFMGAFEGAFAVVQYFSGECARARGTFFNPAFLAGYLIGISPLALSLLAFPSSGKNRFRIVILSKILLFSALVLMVAGMLFSGSRAVIAAVAAFGLVFFSRWKKLAPLILILIIAGLAFIPNPLRERLKTLDDKDIFAWERINIWKGSCEMIAEQPWGVGLGMYKYRYYRYSRPIERSRFIRYLKHADTAHSEPLHLAAELSPLAPVLLMAIAGVLILFGFIKSLRAPPARRPLLAGLSGALLGISFHSLFDSNLHNPSIVLTAVLVASMLLVLMDDEQNNDSTGRKKWLARMNLTFSRPRLIQILTGFASAVLLALILLQAVTYGLYLHYSTKGGPQAAKNLSRLATWSPAYAPLYFELGMIELSSYENRHNPDILASAVRNYLDPAFHLNPENYKYPLEIARAYLYLAHEAQGDQRILGSAEKFVRLSLKRHPYNPFAFSMLAKIEGAGQDKEAQMQWLKKALEIEPFYLSARGRLVQLLIEKGESENAADQLSLLKDQVKQFKDQVERYPLAFPSLYEKQILAIDKGYLKHLESRLEDSKKENEPKP